MSGSIGGDRILRERVMPTLKAYEAKVLKGFDGYKKCEITGSYNAGNKKDHGDIDLVVLVNTTDDVKTLKKRFKKYVEELPDDVAPKFRTGRNQGHKAQLYGSIVTCQFPIDSEEGHYVQIDNILVTIEDEYNFQKSFLNLNAQKQTLITGLVRVKSDKEKEEAFKHFNIQDLPELSSNQEFEFVLSTSGLSLRKVTLSDEMKQLKKEEIWRSCVWDDVLWLLKDYDLSLSYEDLLDVAKDKLKDERSRKRICGIMKSMINIGPGEVGTPKGQAKQDGIKLAYDKLGVKEEMRSLKDYILERLES